MGTRGKNKTAALDELAKILPLERGDLSGFERLKAADQAALNAAVQDVQRRQREELQAAIDNALKHVPALLRKPVVKILRG